MESAARRYAAPTRRRPGATPESLSSAWLVASPWPCAERDMPCPYCVAWAESSCSSFTAARRGRAGRHGAHVVAHRSQQAGESFDVVARKRLEQEAADHLDVTRQHLRK